MKVFFLLLLVANIIFGLVQWRSPVSTVSATPKLPAAKRLQLLSEVAESATSKPVRTQTPTEKAADPVLPQLCYTIGPFKDRSRALEIRQRYSARQIKTTLKSSLEKEYMGVMVFISGHQDRQQALQTAKDLQADGIDDYLIINEPGKANVLSLGVYSLKKNAIRLISKLQRLNYRVASEIRYRDRTIYWLAYRHPEENHSTSFLDKQDFANGIGPIFRACAKAG